MKNLIWLHPNDNVAIAAASIAAGEIVAVDSQEIVCRAPISLGHKIAIRNLCSGDKVLRYGEIIGVMTENAHAGDHVHLHNMRSAYTPSHHRGHQ